MTLVEAVLTVLLGWPRFGAEPDPETDAQRLIRSTQTTIVVVAAAHGRQQKWKRQHWSTVKRAASLLTVIHLESRHARYVWAGECIRGPEYARCDPH